MSPRRIALALSAAVLSTSALAASAHAASPMKCDASAIRLSVLGSAAAEPITANRGGASCVKALSPTSVDLSASPIPITAGALSAATNGSGTRDTQKAFAVGGVTNFAVGALPAGTLPDLSAQIPSSLNVSIPTGTLTTQLGTLLGSLPILGGVVPTLPPTLDINIADAVKSLVSQIPNANVLSLGAANAYATAGCRNGQPVAAGAPQIAGVSVLGQTLDVTNPVNTVLNVLDTQNIDPTKIDITKIVLPSAITSLAPQVQAALLPTIQGLVQTALAALPKITIPAQLADVKVTAGGQTNVDGKLTQHALDVHVALLGQTLLDGTIGEATVTTKDVDCTPVAAAAASPQTASDLALQCTTRALVLTDVVEKNGRVSLVGAADKSLAGKTVDIKFDATGKVVATTKVKSDGSFTTTAALPAKSLRSTNRARYRAVVGKKSSLNLKLARRMAVTSMTSKGGKVTIKGRVTRPLGSPIAKVQVQRRVSCKKNETVKSVTPKSDGTFSVTVDGPTGEAAAVYRLATKVRKTTKNPKLFDTFTLPRGINLKQ